jgi:hypothetical protein
VFQLAGCLFSAGVIAVVLATLIGLSTAAQISSGVGSMSPCGTKQSTVYGRSMSAPPPNSDFNLFGYREGIIYLDAEIAHCALDLAVAEK